MTAAYADVVEEMIANEGPIEGVDVDNGVKWVRQHFAPSDATVVIAELSKHMDPEDDDNPAF